MDKVKLHRCSYTFLHVDLDACWKVERRLKAANIPYEVVKHGFGKGKRPEIQELSGQNKLPVIEFASGAAYREESADMAATIEAGTLESKDSATP
jgi:glutathione S-transferase